MGFAPSSDARFTRYLRGSGAFSLLRTVFGRTFYTLFTRVRRLFVDSHRLRTHVLHAIYVSPAPFCRFAPSSDARFTRYLRESGAFLSLRFVFGRTFYTLFTRVQRLSVASHRLRT